MKNKLKTLFLGGGIALALATTLCLTSCSGYHYETQYKNLGKTFNVHNEYRVAYAEAITFGSEPISIEYAKGALQEYYPAEGFKYATLKIDLEHVAVDSVKEEHKLDCDDFKLKVCAANTTAVVINGELKSGNNYEAICDYTWVGKSLEPGETLSFPLYFDISKISDVNPSFIQLEVDFFVGGTGSNRGTSFSVSEQVRVKDAE